MPSAAFSGFARRCGPIGASKPDWQIVCEIARAMGGHGFAFASPEEIWNEVRDAL